ncbi:hypothetical protein BH24CHL5_BH24CHL5_05250 [soil metagenome]
MSSRQQRRQGVVCGPIRPPERGHDTGAILGRLLGLVVLVLAAGVLGVGAVAFMNDRPASSANPSPTLVAQFSPMPTGSIAPSSSVPSSAPSAQPSVPAETPTAEPTPLVPLVPLVQVGPGFVTFGTKNNSDLRISDPRATFALSERVRWSAHLFEPADSSDLLVRILKLDPDTVEGERMIREDVVKPAVRDAQLFLRRIRPERFLAGPGIYAVRYMRAETLMSEGYFQVTE